MHTSYPHLMMNNRICHGAGPHHSLLLRAMVLALGLALFAMSTNALARKNVLRVAVEYHYPPFSQTDKNGKPYGFNVDIAHALSKAMNMQCEVRAFNWNELIPALLDNRVDAIIANMAKTPERSTVVSFTKPYQRSKTGFVGYGTSPKIPLTLQAARNKRLCTQSGTIQFKYLKDKYGKEAHVIGFPTMEDALLAVAEKECDLALAPLLTAFEFLKSKKGGACELVGKALSEQEYPHNSSHIAVRKSDSELRSKLNRAIDQISASGIYHTISRRYFPFSAL